MAAITTSQTAALPATGAADASVERRASISALRGLVLAVPVGAAMWLLLISLGRLVLS